jgi:hypothetical protein
LALWSRWFGGHSRRSAEEVSLSSVDSRHHEATSSAGTLTVGEVLSVTEHQPLSSRVQQCLLCEATAIIEVDGSSVHIECGSCGQYRASLDAAQALGALVTYRLPALANMRTIVAAYRESRPDRVPDIHVKYVVAERVPTFYLWPKQITRVLARRSAARGFLI